MQNLIDEISKMPGIGPKSAERLAFYILKQPKKEIVDLTNAIIKLKHTTVLCKMCNNLSEELVCEICQDIKRDKGIICVVEGHNDIIALEKSGSYRGVYHCLLGSLSPLEGIGPDELKINQLAERIKETKAKEIIIATDPDTEGEATALYLTRVLKPLNVKITRIAYGIPVGTNLEYSDQATLAKAIEGRRII